MKTQAALLRGSPRRGLLAPHALHALLSGIGVLGLVLAPLFGCSAPKVPEAQALDAEAPTVSPAPSAASPAGSTVASSDAGTAAPEAPKPGTITMDEDEGCTKVAAAFEQKARPKIKACYREGKAKNPVLEGGVRIVINVDGLGKLGALKAEDVTLPESVVKCMVKAVKETPFDDASQCKRKGITLPIQFPTK